MLKIQGLKKKFKHFQALNGLDMEIEEGALYGFVGPNGAGKTTAIRIITGLLLPDEGSVEIAGYDIFKNRETLPDLIRRVKIRKTHSNCTGLQSSGTTVCKWRAVYARSDSNPMF